MREPPSSRCWSRPGSPGVASTISQPRFASARAATRPVERCSTNCGRRTNAWWSAEPCDPLELAMLIVNEQFDLIHYAGHGLSDPKTGQTGWVFAGDCILSAKDIFRVRQVPRLVFANACFSAVTSDYNEQRKHMTGLAQAFFARGIPNFIGAGWQVDDACAEECARWFYARVMGLRSPKHRRRPYRHGAAGHDRRGVARGARDGAHPSSRNRRVGVRTSTMAMSTTSWWRWPTRRCADDAARKPQRTRVAGRRRGPRYAIGAFHLRSRDKWQPRTKRRRPSPSADPNLVYVNGIDFETGNYAFAPRSIDEIAKQVLVRPGVDRFDELRGDKPRSFGLPFDMDPNKLDEGRMGHRLSRRHAAEDPQGAGAADRASPQAGRRCASRCSTTRRASRRATGISVTECRPAHRSRNRSLLPAAGRPARSDPVRIPVSAWRRICDRPAGVRHAGGLRALRAFDGRL